jgi:hypothetical protein
MRRYVSAGELNRAAAPVHCRLHEEARLLLLAT